MKSHFNLLFFSRSQIIFSDLTFGKQTDAKFSVILAHPFLELCLLKKIIMVRFITVKILNIGTCMSEQTM